MNNETQLEVELFEALMAVPDEGHREKLIEAACDNKPRLRQRIHDLLAAADGAGSFMDQPAAELAETSESISLTEQPGQTIGRYKLLEKIGEGGFGVVYMADQLRPIERRVALKIIKLGMDSKQVIARFEAERQALALMDHPNIAKILDAGATDAGRPYFVMELVRGIPVTEYCDDRNLTTEERLRLFSQICSAVQHAHQKGIIHRDIKPNNILVATNGDEAVPKVIDFGIAKATQGRLTDKTLFTQFRQFIGTPAYMSPEQAQMSAVDVDTRSDIYSLGVLLYELMTGATPLNTAELVNVGYEEICRRIREDEALKPSKQLSSLHHDQLSTLAKQRRTAVAQFTASIRGDLDWIAMKAVEKDRARRYPTAGAMADDINRYLKREPVLAVPPSPLYLAKKYFRRHQRMFATAGFIAATLIAATTTSTWWAITANRATDRLTQEIFAKDQAVDRAQAAEREARDAQQLAESQRQNARRVAYASDMQNAFQALRLNNLGLAKRIIDSNVPTPSSTDLRHWEWRSLWQQSRGDAVTTFGRQVSTITSMRHSPDGKWLATGEIRGEIRVWDTTTEKIEHTLLSGQGLQFGFVAFSPKGDRLYATAPEGIVKVWEVPGFKETEIQLNHGSRIRDIKISPNGELLVAFGFDKDVTVWSLDNHELMSRLLGGRGGGVQHGKVAISADNSTLVLGLGDRIRILDLKTLEQKSIVNQGGSNALAISPNGEIIASARNLTDPVIYLHQADDGKLIDQLAKHTLYLFELEFSPDGKLLASASADQTVRLWETDAWTEKAVLRGHENEVWTLNFNLDGKSLASGCKDGRVCIWDPNGAANSRLSARVEQSLGDWHREYSQFSFSQDRRTVAMRNGDKSISIRSAMDLSPHRTLTEINCEVRGVRCSPAENLIAAGDYAGRIHLVRPDDIGRTIVLDTLPKAEVFPSRFSRDGQRLVAIARTATECRCYVVSIQAGRVEQSWLLPSEDGCATISPDGTFVATGHSDDFLRIWRVDKPNNPIQVRIGGPIQGVAFSPDGKFVVAASGSGRATIIDMNTFQPMDQLVGHMQGVHSVSFSPDGKRIITGGSTGESVKLWDFETRRELMTLVDAGYSFRQVEFSRDGDAICAFGGAGNLTMWRVPSFDEITAWEDKNSE